MRDGLLGTLAWLPLLISCGSKRSVPADPSPPGSSSAQALVAVPPAAQTSDPSPEGARERAPEGGIAGWLRSRLPPGGRIVSGEGGKVSVLHMVGADDTPLTIARLYLDFTDVYRAEDLAKEIAKISPALAPGAWLEVPHLLSDPPRGPDEDRLRWPAERALKGVYISGLFAGYYWPETIDKLGSRKLNAVVLDAKSYDGPITYPSHVKLATETGAAKDPPIRDLSRAIRFAHARGVHVIMRISCFHDPWAAKYAPRLSLMNTSGRPFQMGWMDPSNPEAQEYIVDLVRESIDLGADEIQLDYVRFPVQSRGLSNAVMPAPDGHRSQAMKAFVARVHAVTEARRIPLSLDVFGVTATGDWSDIEALGQNLGVLGPEAEALSPMMYPSHYAKGWHGFQEPGNHPEIIGIGTRSAVDRLKADRVSGTIVRPWLQAMSYKSSVFGPKYIADEIKSAESSGAVGWLMWDPQNSYWAVWQAIQPVKEAPKERDPRGGT
jgi:hypothetical protein